LQKIHNIIRISVVVTNAWGEGDQHISHRLDKVRADSIVFNEEVFGNILKRKKEIEGQLKYVQLQLERVDSIRLNMQETSLHKA
jgi:hypothetical protein